MVLLLENKLLELWKSMFSYMVTRLRNILHRKHINEGVWLSFRIE